MLGDMRNLAVLAYVDDLVANPTALAAYGDLFGEDDDATLVVYAPDEPEAGAVARLTRALAAAGVDPDHGPDMLLFAAPGGEATERALAQRVHAVYAHGAAGGPLGPIPRYGPEDVGALRHKALPAAVATPKGRAELSYWEERKRAEGTLENEAYAFYYTDHFGLPRSFYAGKRMLDVGCGPRGSLEWADMTAERVGLDPLADSYLELGAAEHAMTYVAAGSERIPFPDGHFDVVASVNSLDHVDDLDATIAELKRVLAPGGTLLLLTDVNHDPNVCEPQEFSWEIVGAFADELRVEEERHLERGAHGMLAALRSARPYDDSRPHLAGILSVRFTKPDR
jgi:2-polyprenyl-3-methyl-5-hydroxy-6-metoxy-1,4-benzoquinol methylase